MHNPEKSSDLAAVGDTVFFTDTAVLIALALTVVPERDLRVDEDKEASFSVFFEGFTGKSAGPQHS